jgi:hypothetical protein
MSLLEQFERLMGESLGEEEQALLAPLTDFAVLAMDAGYDLGRDLAQASRLEVLARAAAGRRRQLRRVVEEVTAAEGPVGKATVLEPIDGGASGAALVAQLGLQLARQTGLTGSELDRVSGAGGRRRA